MDQNPESEHLCHKIEYSAQTLVGIFFSEKMMEFPCKTCDHMAESRLALQQHCVQAHFRCNQCQKRFFEKKGIVNHLANVHGEKDHIYLID